MVTVGDKLPVFALQSVIGLERVAATLQAAALSLEIFAVSASTMTDDQAATIAASAAQS